MLLDIKRKLKKTPLFKKYFCVLSFVLELWIYFSSDDGWQAVILKNGRIYNEMNGQYLNN